MKLSLSTTYALRAVMNLARQQPRRPVSCAHLADAGAMPCRYLRHVLRKLVSAGILRSTRGADGGYTLSRNPETISLCEIMEAVEGEIAPAAVNETSGVHHSLKAVHDSLAQITRRMREDLAAVNVADVVRE